MDGVTIGYSRYYHSHSTEHPTVIHPLRSSKVKKNKLTSYKSNKKNLNIFSNYKIIQPPTDQIPISARRRNQFQNQIESSTNSHISENFQIHEPQALPHSPKHHSFKRINENLMNSSIKPLNDNCCSYCHEILNLLTAITLPCGHKIHPQCLITFHRFSTYSTKKTCPLCYHPYDLSEIQTKIRTQNKAAIKIQRIIRGFLVRLHALESIPTASKLYIKYVMKKANRASSRLTHAIDNQSDTVDAVITAVDHELDWARSIMKQIEIREAIIDWPSIKQKVLDKGCGSCTICLHDIDSSECVVTSCGHTFHQSCLHQWMDYCSSNQKQVTCPECRSPFQYRDLVYKRVTTSMAVQLYEEGMKRLRENNQ